MRTSSAEASWPGSATFALWSSSARPSSSSPGRTVQPTGLPVRDSRLCADGWAVLSLSRRVAAAATLLLVVLGRTAERAAPEMGLPSAPGHIALLVGALIDPLAVLAAVAAAVTAELRCCAALNIA